MNKAKFKRILTIVIVVLALILGYYLYNKYYLKEDNSSNTGNENEIINENKIDKELKEENTTTKEDEEEVDIFVVEIKGYVMYPGCYTFNKDKVIIQDVIDIAGGLSKRGNVDNINCAQLVENHSTIYIGSIESKSYVLSKDETLNLININTCNKEELMSIPGIGEAKANAIIEYRKQNGYFNSTEDIKKVSGIGDSLYEKIKVYITI